MESYWRARLLQDCAAASRPPRRRRTTRQKGPKRFSSLAGFQPICVLKPDGCYWLMATLGVDTALRICETARRFFDQHDSFDSTQTGRSLPNDIVVNRLASTPRLTRYSLTAVARRAPSARLYSRVPRSSALPSMVTVTALYLENQAACFC